MDRKITKKKVSLSPKTLLISLSLISITWWAFANVELSGNALKIEKQRLMISEVKYAELEDYIPVRGQVKPSRTVYLDSIEGGRVEEIFIEEGAEVKAGDVILRLSNTNLQLDVISREAQVSEQLNNLRNTKLAIEKETLNLKRDIIEIDYQLVRLRRTAKQRKLLAEKKLISQDELLETQDELNYYEKRRALIVERQNTDNKVREVQMKQLESSVSRLEKNLNVARGNLENLNVKAPVSGKLTALNVELGESKSRGQRLGQVDNLASFKVTAFVDEFYIARLEIGQQAKSNIADADYPMLVSKIYSQVSNGQFEIELKFQSALPENIRRGQTIQMKLQLGDGNNVMVIEKGSFVQDTGGNWAFVLNEQGDKAIKTSIQSGKSNPEYIEIISGLSLGDKIVTSSYAGFKDKQTLILN